MACSTPRFALAAAVVFAALAAVYVLAAISQPSALVVTGECILGGIALAGCGYMLANCGR
ncbi:hypothetical protein QSJ19_03055 [Gordonia sp. ABSL11-1]|uniref:hypothetical protein n=1 Tax=Gordonia sp. ABSL11-1 TaxID=3053924 RepID=UPI002572A71A|nr:hypothetical protein [Gordonia sp. ABSL11-1]MDL9944578.1 hypothetical protein [Gordonia sp. ABSL11-1]